VTKTPFPYQFEGADFLASHGVAGLFDEPGLGKTLQAITAFEAIGATRIIVVCPANVRAVWKGEIRQVSPRQLRILEGKDIQDLNFWRRGKPNVFLLSYEMAAKWAPALQEFVDVVILDESHYLKSPTATRTRAILGRNCDGKDGLASFAQHTWFLTGTCMPNDPLDIWTFLRFTETTTLGRQTFTNRYFTSRSGAFSARQSPRKETLPELRSLINSVSIRRTLKSVGLQIPDIFLGTQTIDGDTREIMGLLKQHPGLSDAVLDAVKKGSLSFLDAQHIGTLRRLVGEAKAPAAAQLLMEDLKGGVDKIVAFGIHKKVLDILEDVAKRNGIKSVRIDGSTPDHVREDAVHFFQNDPETRLFIGNIRAAGTGYTLTSSADVVLVESSWAPADNAQAIKRVHRISQTRKVRARILTLENSIDERVNDVVATKTASIIKVEGK